MMIAIINKHFQRRVQCSFNLLPRKDIANLLKLGKSNKEYFGRLGLKNERVV